MTYAEALQVRFAGLDPVVDDLFLLEEHEVAELLDRAPPDALAAVLHADVRLLRFLRVRCPEARARLDDLLARHGPIPTADLPAAEGAVVWEVADLIAYERAPALYDERSGIPFVASAVTTLAPLADALVVDAGAGTGRVALTLAPLARQVVAVEPVAALRHYLRGRTVACGLTNLLVTDGFLDAIPLPDASADVLVTCHAIGWRLPAEIVEIDRVLTRGGIAVHLFAQAPPNPITQWLLAAGYRSDSHAVGPSRLSRFWAPRGRHGRL